MAARWTTPACAAFLEAFFVSLGKFTASWLHLESVNLLPVESSVGKFTSSGAHDDFKIVTHNLLSWLYFTVSGDTPSFLFETILDSWCRMTRHIISALRFDLMFITASSADYHEKFFKLGSDDTLVTFRSTVLYSQNFVNLWFVIDEFISLFVDFNT